MEIDYRKGKDWNRDHREATVVTLAKENAGLDQSGDDQGERASDSGYILKGELLDFTNGLNGGCEELRVYLEPAT